MQAHNRAFGYVSILCALALAACAPSTAAPTGPGGPILEEGEGPRQLLLVGEAFRTVTEGEEHVIEMRYLRENGAVIVGGIVEFVAEGDTGGASLSARTAETNNDGLATVVLRAGRPARVIVTATAEGVEQPLSAIIDVVESSIGQLQLTISYGGARALRSVEMGLFTNTTCQGVVEGARSASEARRTHNGAVVTFNEVQMDQPMAIFGLGIDNHGFVAAEGCLDITLEEPSLIAELVITDTDHSLSGTYDVVERFDVTAGAHPTLDGLLEAMSGLSSDPAQYIVSFVANSDSTPDWLRSAIGNPIMSSLVTSTLRGALEGVEMPGMLTATLDLGADLDTALTGLELTGELVLGEADEFGAAPATHHLTGMQVPVDGELQSRTLRGDATSFAMTVAEDLQMPAHTLEVAFGTLVETILEEILLPRLPGAPTSMHGLMTQIFDCDDISEWLLGDDSLAASLANSVCDAGVSMLADEIEEYVEDLFEYDELTLQGAATVTDSDSDYDRDTLSGPALDATWTGADGQLSLIGNMDGTLRGDTTGQQHPMRDRISPMI